MKSTAQAGGQKILRMLVKYIVLPKNVFVHGGENGDGSFQALRVYSGAELENGWLSLFFVLEKKA